MSQATTIAGDRPAVIGELAYAAATRKAIAIEGPAASQLLDYIRELEATARDYADRQRDGTAGLREPVLAFAWHMEHRLRKHDEDYGPRDWLNAPNAPRLLQDVRDRTTALADALADWSRDDPTPAAAATAARQVALKAADVANLAMMLADVAGGLEGAGPGQPHKRAKRLSHMHRMLERLLRLIDYRAADGITPQTRIAWLHTDRKALEFALRQLDPHGNYRPPAQLQGDGSGQPLPPVSDQVRLEPAIETCAECYSRPAGTPPSCRGGDGCVRQAIPCNPPIPLDPRPVDQV